MTIWLNAGNDLQVPLDRVEAAGGKVLQPKEAIGEESIPKLLQPFIKT